MKMVQVNEAILRITRQIGSLLKQLEAPEYSKPLPEFDGNSIGQHFRHILEFFQCLEKGIGIDQGFIDYASRNRNLLYENSPELTAAAFQEFAKALGSWNNENVVTVIAEFNGLERPQYRSTLGRELLFVYDHAVHHLAIIKIGLHCHFPNIKIEADLGVSPSTIKFRQLSS